MEPASGGALAAWKHHACAIPAALLCLVKYSAVVAVLLGYLWW
jgi:hypothetical protein